MSGPGDRDDTTRDAPARGAGLADEAAAAFRGYLAGDEQRMGELVDLLTPLLWHTARGAGATEHEAGDAVQTTWLKLVDKADTVRDPQAVLGWLLTTVRRTVSTARRRQREVVVDLGDEARDRPSDEPDPANLAALGDRQRVLWGHVAALDERCRYLLRVIAFAQRPDYAGIAEDLGMPVGSIGPTRGRCLGKLRGLLDADPRWEGTIHA